MSGGNIPLISAKSSFCLQRNSIWKYFFLLLDGIPYGQSLQIYIEKPKLKSTSALRKEEENFFKKNLAEFVLIKKAFYIINPLEGSLELGSVTPSLYTSWTELSFGTS